MGDSGWPIAAFAAARAPAFVLPARSAWSARSRRRPILSVRSCAIAPSMPGRAEGLTLSGGEPLAQPAFAREILYRCHEQGIHTALDTTACAPWPTLAGLLPYTDLVLLDIKAFDPDRHRRLTGVSNEVILANAVALAESQVDLVVRVPIIPDQNDDEEDLRAVAHFLSGLPGLRRVELLPYNRMAQAKYSRLGLDYAAQRHGHAAVGGDADGTDVVRRPALPRVRYLGPGRAQACLV